MNAAEQTPARTPEQKYTSYAKAETAQGYEAWRAGQYHRAIKLWCSAARWSQFAAKAAQGGAQ